MATQMGWHKGTPEAEPYKDRYKKARARGGRRGALICLRTAPARLPRARVLCRPPSACARAPKRARRPPTRRR